MARLIRGLLLLKFLQKVASHLMHAERRLVVTLSVFIRVCEEKDIFIRQLK